MDSIIVVSVRDKLAAVYSQPMYFATRALAIRAFHDALNDSNNAMSKHATDYELYQLATFNDNSGRFANEEHPELLATGKDTKGS